MEKSMKILVTGACGFIGFHLSKNLLALSHDIIGVDNLNDYYDVQLKEDRLAILKQFDAFRFEKMDLSHKNEFLAFMQKEKPDIVIHLAAQAGVRYSLENPYAYLESNLSGFLNVLEGCRQNPVKHLLYASSSSVYGGNQTVPFSTQHNVDHPVSLYAATKKSNELMAHSYSHLYNIPTTGLRFFTVYGPYGRPDMAYYSFTKNILEGNPIKVFNNGVMERDFTYIDDIVEGITNLLEVIPQKNENWTQEEVSTSFAPYKIYNIGNNKPVTLMHFIETLEKALGKEADKIYMEMQSGDVLRTYADITDLENDIQFKPTIQIEEGLKAFVDWYLWYYKSV